MILLPETTTCTCTTPYCVWIASPATVRAAVEVDGADVEGADVDGADVEGAVLGNDAPVTPHGRRAPCAT